MKHKFLLLILCCSLLVACKKSSDPVQDDNKRIKEQVIGNWQLISQTATYHDKSGNVVKSNTEQTPSGRIFSFSANNVLKAKDTGTEFTYQYSIEPLNGKQRLTVKNDNTSEAFDIAITNDTMAWYIEQEITNDPAYSKGSITYNFKRQ